MIAGDYMAKEDGHFEQMKKGVLRPSRQHALSEISEGR
jgi:hypothetical protein